MKLTKCEFNHYYDADKYDVCPQCLVKGQAAVPVKPESANAKKSKLSSLFFGKEHKNEDIAKADNSGDDVTISAYDEVVSDIIYDDKSEKPAEKESIQDNKNEEDNQKSSLSVQLSESSASGDIEDVKTVAYYDFGETAEPVVGWLVVVTEEDKGKSFNLKCGKNFIGRNGTGTKVDVDLDKDSSISRGEQAALIYEPKKRKFLLQTSNGNTLVYVNDDLLMSFSELNAYDKITLGKTDMLFIPFCSDKFSWDE